MRDVVPTDADRDAAARLYLMLQGAPSSPHDESEAEAIRRGEWDQQDIVQALAQHALSARPSPARDDFEIDTPLSKPLVVVRTQARQLDAARDEVLEALRQKLWMIACHATGGGIPEIEGIDRPTNDICVQITAHVNRIYAAGKEAALKSHPPSTVGEDAVARLMHVIDRDRYAAAIVLNNIKKVLAGYSWLSEAGRGPYAYDDERYQREFGDALKAIEAALTPLGKLAFDKTDCTTDPDKVHAARQAGVERAAQLAS